MKQMSERWQQTLVGPAIGLVLALLGWGVAEVRGVRSEMNERFDRMEQRIDALEHGFDSRLDKLEQNQAVLLERTAPLAPVASKPRK